MKDTDKLINESILNVFSGFKSALKKEYKDRALEISPMHFRSLQIIRHNNKKATSQIVSETLNRDKSQIARLIGELVKQGFVKAEPDPKDKRNRLLMLTGAGEAVTKELELVEQSVIKIMTRGIAKQDLNQFVEVSKKMRKNLGASLG